MMPLVPYIDATSNLTTAQIPLASSGLTYAIVPLTICLIILIVVRLSLVTRHQGGSDAHTIGRSLFTFLCISIFLNPLLAALLSLVPLTGTGSFLIPYILLPLLVSVGVFHYLASKVYGVDPKLLHDKHYFTAVGLAVAGLCIIPIAWAFWFVTMLGSVGAR